MKTPGVLRFLLLTCFIVCSLSLRSQSISGVINSYYKVTAINTLTNTLTLPATGGLVPGSKILIIQMKGATITSTNTASFGDITSINQAGNYEVNELCGISGNDIILKYQLLRSYDPAGLVQIVTVPVYNSVTITDTLKAAAWDPVSGTGGVVVVEATGTITMNSPIDASGKGFTGGALQNYTGCLWTTNVSQYSLSIAPADPNVNAARKGEGIANFILNNEFARGKQANGGGGANNHNTGGGGGSNIGSGGAGGFRSGETVFQCHGASGGIGGLGIQSFGYTVPNNRVFMGGGGGAGHQNNFLATAGGNGGGIVLVKANSITGSSAKFLANGGAPFNPTCSNPLIAEGDGGGGGGAGGTILLDIQNYSGSFIAEARGADGSISGNLTNSCVGPGGGGGGGMVWVSGGSIPGNLTTSLLGGAAGFISLSNSGGCAGQNNGATAGSTGTSLTGYVIPFANTFICAPLSAKYVKDFKGTHSSNQNTILWTLINRSSIKSVDVEKSLDAVRYSSIGSFGSESDIYADMNPENKVYFYRLKITDISGGLEYSKTISIDARKNPVSIIQNIYPNPTSNSSIVSINSKEAVSAKISVYNQYGQLLQDKTYALKAGSNQIEYSFTQFSSGVYHLSIQIAGELQIKKIIVQR